MIILPRKAPDLIWYSKEIEEQNVFFSICYITFLLPVQKIIDISMTMHPNTHIDSYNFVTDILISFQIHVMIFIFIFRFVISPDPSFWI